MFNRILKIITNFTNLQNPYEDEIVIIFFIFRL